MKKKLFLSLLCISLFTVGMVSCDGTYNSSEAIKVSIDEESGETSSEDVAVPSTVRLVYLDEPYVPSSEEQDLKVVWVSTSDSSNQFSCKVDENGEASIPDIDGEFAVYLSGMDESDSAQFTYNPNIYKVSTDSPDATIEMIPLKTFSSGDGTGMYSPNIYEAKTTGTYRVKIRKESSIVYFQYAPRQAGYYTVYTMASLYEDLVNPTAERYDGSFAYKRYAETLDSGLNELEGGFTKNWIYDCKIASDEIGGVFAFGFKAESKTGSYPVCVDFTIQYEDEYSREGTNPETVEAEEIYYKRDENYNIVLDDYGKPVINYVLDENKNFDLMHTWSDSEAHKNYSYYRYNKEVGSDRYLRDDENGLYVKRAVPGPAPGSESDKIDADLGGSVLDGTKYTYNTADGYYHFGTADGPVVFVYMKTACPFLDLPFPNIEDPGNAALRVKSGKLSYQRFIYGEMMEYCDVAHSSYVPCSAELHDFLILLSKGQALFFDGLGWAEQAGTYASEADQWLFGCCFFVS